MAVPPVWLIVPNYNGQEHLAYSIPSLLQTSYDSYRIVVVDDCSTDSSCEYIQTYFPQVRLLEMAHNKGFAGAVNAGVQDALAGGAKYVGVCNNDIRVVPEWLSPVVERLEIDDSVAVIGYVELARHCCLPRTDQTVLEFVEAGPNIPGMLYVCRASMFEKVGLYDEGYFMYGEESDLLARVEAAGFRILQSNIPVWHFAGGTTQKEKFKAAWLSYRNAMRYAIKTGTMRAVARQIGALLYYATASRLRHPSENVLLRVILTKRSLPLEGAELEKFRAIFQRFRPSIRLVNVSLWSAAVFWNLVCLPQTLWARHQDARRMKTARR
jgi:GT2 family glycosyltransferase